MTLRQLLFCLVDPRGRCDRKGLVMVALGLLGLQLLAVGLMWAGEVSYTGPVAVTLKVLFFWMATVAVSKRLHDLDRTAWWIAGSFFIVIVWSVILSLCLLVAYGDSVLDQTSGAFMASVAGTMLPVFVATLWLHFAKGQVVANRFGSVPGACGFSPVPQAGSDIGASSAGQEQNADATYA